MALPVDSFSPVRARAAALRGALLAAALVVFARPTAAQDLMEMNRAGRWAEVIPAAEALLRDPALPAVRACETYSQLIHAATYAGQAETARAALRAFDQRCAEFPEDAWFRREVRTLSAALQTQPAPPAGASAGPSAPGAGWQVPDAASLGLDTAALERHRNLCERSGADACLVAYRGRIVQEWYGPGYRYPMPTMSSMKSWTGLLAGLLIEDGKIAGVDEPVSRWIPEWRAGAEAGVTVRHLLTMTGGLRRRWGRGPGDEMVGATGDKNALVLSLPLDHAPGERWEYSNEGAQLLSPVLERAAGRPLQQYAVERLLGPLGMDSTTLRLDAAGHAWTYADALTTLRDFAKICQLALDGGRWNGRQVVPEAWIRASLAPTPQNPGYGFLWWVGTAPVVYGTRGYLDTDCDAYPEWGLVVARMQARPRPDAPVRYRAPETARVLEQVVRSLLPVRQP